MPLLIWCELASCTRGLLSMPNVRITRVSPALHLTRPALRCGAPMDDPTAADSDCGTDIYRLPQATTSPRQF